MMQVERPLDIQVVSTSTARKTSFEEMLGPDSPHQVRQVIPKFSETTMTKRVSDNPAEFPFYTAEQKAFQDVSALLVLGAVNKAATEGFIGDLHEDKRTIRVYGDTVQVVFAGDTSDESAIILEKPTNIDEWMKDEQKGAMVQSGKNFEICSALVGIDMTNPNLHPSTVMVRVAGKMKPFTKDDVKRLLAKHGEQAILNTAGGISLWNGGTELHDVSVPLKVMVQGSPGDQPIVLYEIPHWGEMDNSSLRRLVYGAVPEAFTKLLSRFNESQPNEIVPLPHQ